MANRISKKIGIDLDGVIVDFHQYFIEDFNRRNSSNLTIEDWTDYQFSKAGFTQDSLNDYIVKMSMRGEFIHPKPMKDAVQSVNQLHDKNSIHIISYRNGRAKESAIAWLERWDIKYDSISFTKDKARLAYLLNCDLMIEDDPKNCQSVATIGIETLLFDRPYNRQLEDFPLITRVNNWKEILEICQ